MSGAREAEGLLSSHPVEETTMMARGLTSSVSKSVRLPLPSRLELSITSGLESTQNISRRFTSTARPSGLTRSARPGDGGGEVGGERNVEISGFAM